MDARTEPRGGWKCDGEAGRGQLNVKGYMEGKEDKRKK